MTSRWLHGSFFESPFPVRFWTWNWVGRCNILPGLQNHGSNLVLMTSRWCHSPFLESLMPVITLMLESVGICIYNNKNKNKKFYLSIEIYKGKYLKDRKLLEKSTIARRSSLKANVESMRWPPLRQNNLHSELGLILTETRTHKTTQTVWKNILWNCESEFGKD